MPLYDYRCPECGKTNEFWISIPKLDSTVCTCECGAQMVRLMPGAHKFSFAPGSFFEPYVDTDIHPEGKPIQIHSQQQFFNECQKHGRGFRAVRDKLR